ncbi:MAG: universal stress protein [Chloroflexi bacterium]|nr:universal stress protein [Chloroflexota bacterium]
MQKRYKHLLVPLDGSELAELALVDAFALAKLIEAEMTLLRVVLPIKEVIAEHTHHAIYVDEQWKTRKKLARDYLNDICKRYDCGTLTIHTAVKKGPAAETIIDYAREHPIDLIVMATHGRSGLKRWVYGSVADKVLRGADSHVWLVRAHG